MSFVSAIIVGLIVGALGRLVVPGRQAIGCLMTVLLGIIGAVAGTAIAHSADVHSRLLILVLQVGIAAVGVALVAGSWRTWRR
jgi:uncharacterized membrane protein YeaQ/YmgE (transglycosylase-associated protein family)